MTMINLKNGVRKTVFRNLSTTNYVVAKCSDRTSDAAKTDLYDVVLESFCIVCAGSTATVDVWIATDEGAAIYLLKSYSQAAGAAPYVFPDHCVVLRPGDSLIAKASSNSNIDATFSLIVGSPIQNNQMMPLGGGYTGGPAIGLPPGQGFGGNGGPAGTGGGMIRGPR